MFFVDSICYFETYCHKENGHCSENKDVDENQQKENGIVYYVILFNFQYYDIQQYI